MTSLLRSFRFAPLILLPFAPITASSQEQPPQAVNQQDEVLTIPLASAEDTDEALRILRSDNKFETNDYVSQVFEVFNAPAYEFVLIIREAVGQEKGVVRAVQTRPADGSPVRQFLLVTTTDEHLPGIAEAIKALDVPGFVNSQGRGRRAFRVRYRRASDLAEVLRSTRLTSLGRVYPDDLTNTLYYDDTDYVADAVESYVTFFDVPIPQIEFDVQIVEVREEDAGKVGVDWDAWKRSLGGQFTFTGNAFEGGESYGRLDALLTLDANVLANFLNFTVQRGNARLVQRSRLTASNLQPAVLSDLKRVPFADFVLAERSPAVLTEVNPIVDAGRDRSLTVDGEAGALSPRPLAIIPPTTTRLSNLSSEEEGLFIRIQPVIGAESVTADIEVAVNTVVGFDRLDVPIVTEQTLLNQFTLRNGEKLLLGSLEREIAVESRRGIPGLRDLPVIQLLTSVRSTRTESSRLFILATPNFSNFGYDARTLKEIGSRPTLVFDETPPVLEDGVPEALFHEVDEP